MIHRGNISAPPHRHSKVVLRIVFKLMVKRPKLVRLFEHINKPVLDRIGSLEYFEDMRLPLGNI